MRVEPIMGFGVGIELLEDDGEAFIFIDLLLIRIIIQLAPPNINYSI